MVVAEKQMTKAAKRVAIARDVLKQIMANKVTLVRRTYLGNGVVSTSVVNGPHDRAADELAEVCEVCALGCCLLSKMRLYNKVNVATLGRLSVCDPKTFVPSARGEAMIDGLKDVFPIGQLILIEMAFEQFGHRAGLRVTNWGFRISKDRLDAAWKFGSRYKSKEKCVAAIMRNIIRNKGTFTP